MPQRTRRSLPPRFLLNNRKYGRIESKQNIVEALVVLDKRNGTQIKKKITKNLF